MFYLRELLNSYSSLEIYVRRPSLYPFRRPFLLKRGKKEALCPISLKEGRGWAQVGRYPGVFCKLGKKMVLALTLFIIIVKELELDEFQIIVVQIFLYYSFMIYDEVTSRTSKMNDRNQIWLISLTEILTEEEDSREIFAVNIELCIFWLFFVLTNNTNKLVKVVIWRRNCCFISGEIKQFLAV